MRPVQDTPTRRSDYALVSATYLGLLAGVAEAARRRQTAAVPAAEIVPLAAASFAVSKLLVHEKVETWVRAPFVDDAAGRPKGRGLRYAVGELLSCTRCMGAWSALGLVALRTQAPGTGRLVTTALAASAGSDFAHSAFSLICRQADLIGERLDAARRQAGSG